MHILLLKMSSMGDVIHALPALTDARKAYPTIRFDWVVEEGFAQIPGWHPGVNEIIPIALRRWRKDIGYWHLRKHPQWKAFRQQLQATRYDAVIDAQGLLKSAFIGRLAQGKRHGYDYRSAREPLSSFSYHQRFSIPTHQHAVTRIRELFSQVLHYPLHPSEPDYGITQQTLKTAHTRPFILFIHGTSRIEKCWSENHWIALGKKFTQAGFHIKLPWGNAEEKARAERIAQQCDHVTVLPKLSLSDIAKQLQQAYQVITVDTGIGHLAAALGVPTIALYGPTDPKRIGTYGKNQVHLCTEPKNADINSLAVEQVWGAFLSGSESRVEVQSQIAVDIGLQIT